jgi:D-alanyl-D-alanine carboxypeptidase
MLYHVTRRSLLALGTGLLVAPALIPSLPAGARSTRTRALIPATPEVATLDAVLQAALDDGLPGIVLRLERGADVVYSGAAGVANIEDQAPLQDTDRFRIYSITKTFTAIVILQLVDEKVLALDDTVAQWLDVPAVSRIPNIDRITLRQLLNHTSGIYDYADDNDSPFWQDAFLGPDADWTKVWTIEELLAYADGTRHAPYFEPGQGVFYSNTEYLLLGLVVEAATGRTFGDELRTRILEPLALGDTFLAEGGEMPEDVVRGYQLLEGELIDLSASNLSWVWTAGGMVSTSADLGRFARAVFGGELLSPASFTEMFTFVAEPGRPGFAFGMGLYQIGSPNGALVGNDGQSAGFSSSMMRLSEADITVVVLTNMAPDEGTLDKVRDEAIAWVLAQTPVTTNGSATPTR